MSFLAGLFWMQVFFRKREEELIIDLNIAIALTISNKSFVLNLQVALDSSYWTWVNHTFIWGSIAVYFILQLALNYALVWIGADAPYVGSLTMVSSNMILKFIHCYSSAA